jgi:glutaredoxin
MRFREVSRPRLIPPLGQCDKSIFSTMVTPERQGGLESVYKLIAVWMVLVFTLADAQVYRWVDEDGNVHFSDHKPVEETSEEVELQPINSYEAVEIRSAARRSTADGHQPRVVMYATDWCPYCAKARQYFADNGIRYTEYDIDKDPAARRRYEAMDATGVPVILVGDTRINGFSVEGFERVYE